MFARWQARMLKNPTGLFARWYLGPLWNRRNAVLNDAALEELLKFPGGRVLEIGFGGGYLLERLAATANDAVLHGVDASPTLVHFVSRRLRPLIRAQKLTLHCATAEALPFPDAAFDQVVSVNSLFYWDDPSRGFAEIRRGLATPGRLVLCLTEKESLRVKKFSRHGLKLFEAEELERLLAAANFTGIRCERRQDAYRRFLLITANAR
ncbi:MAG: methyltransferase domain-containing protein [Myxococcales bacterium]|nr:methyltransferase domain-containing protein [Myxococcales bacterium]